LLFEEAQVTDAVMSCKLASENVPVAVNCWRVPRDKTASPGVISIETKVALALETVRVEVAEVFPELAEIVETPGVRPFTRPALPATMLATAAFPEVQLTEEVISC
jgi:hypothetical protein